MRKLVREMKGKKKNKKHGLVTGLSRLCINKDLQDSIFISIR